MRSSTVLALIGATLAIASPVNHEALHKKAYVTDMVTTIVYVTVTAGNLPPPATTASASTTEPHHKPQETPAAPKPVEVHPPPPPPAPKPNPIAPPPPPPFPTYPAVQPPKVQAAPVPVVQTPEVKAAPVPVVQAPDVKAAAAPVAAPAPEAANKPTDYKSTCLNYHNILRGNHGAVALGWDETLANYAKTIANKCVFAHDMSQGSGGYGQNLAAFGRSSDLSSINLANVAADAIANQWYYGEAANMPYGEDSPAINNVPEFLHFSQVVWKSTSKVGCYTATCQAGTIFSYNSLFTVCNYKTAGNVLGSFASEVSRPVGKAVVVAKID
ncbi:uncharacterized protein RAG0_17174 [Rhynchosporium agropyri]|uniref:SCP domain-containing protein n=1 Tax=Rhynchosporium agropyri TaxID=914238 RepID=A0A1E1LT42_9HELO|nr:uncharacterized protein RAG0_17174 [Rhynchosporium agropyri]